MTSVSPSESNHQTSTTNKNNNNGDEDQPDPHEQHHTLNTHNTTQSSIALQKNITEAARVKLYQLTDAGEWEDRGTGHVTCLQTLQTNNTKDQSESNKSINNESNNDNENNNSLTLLVRSENSNEVLLEHHIFNGIEYQRQGETIIAWCEAESGVDLALSFQDNHKCAAVWNLIQAQVNANKHNQNHNNFNNMLTAQGNDNSNEDNINNGNNGTGVRPNAQDEDRDNNNNLNNSFTSEGYNDNEFVNLPLLASPPSLVNLEEINHELQTVNPSARASLSQQLLMDHGLYIRQLYALTQDLEDLEQISSLQLIFSIFKSIFLLNDVSIIEFLISRKRIYRTLAALEYDPELPTGTDNHRHRKSLRTVTFKILVNFSDSVLVRKIQTCYYLSYIKDVILHRYLDDSTLNTFTSLTFVSNVTMISRITNNSQYLNSLFQQCATYAPMSHLTPPANTETPSKQSDNHNNEDDADDDAPPLDLDDGMDSFSESEYNEDDHKQKYLQTEGPESSKLGPGLSEDQNKENSHALSGSKRQRLSNKADDKSSRYLGRRLYVLEECDPYTIRISLFSFLQELVGLAKGVQIALRDNMYRTLSHHGIFNVIEQAALASDPRDEKQLGLWLSIADILTNLLNHDPSLLRAHVIQHHITSNNTSTPKKRSSDHSPKLSPMHPPTFSPPSHSHIHGNAHPNNHTHNNVSTPSHPSRRSILGRIFDVLVLDGVDSGLIHQMSFLLRLAVDPSAESQNPPLPGSSSTGTAAASGGLLTNNANPDKDIFLEMIYTHHMPHLMSLLNRPLPALTNLNSCTAIYHTLELLTFCAHHHSVYFRPFALKYNLLNSIVNLICLPRSDIKCAVIRFIRTIVGTKDEVYISKLSSSSFKLLDPIIEVFLDNGARYNLLNSVILELFHFIRVENIKPLVEYIVANHMERFESITYVTTFQDLKSRYEQNIDISFQDDHTLEQEKFNQSNNHNFPKRSELDIDDIFVTEDEDDNSTHLKSSISHTHRDHLDQPKTNVIVTSSNHVDDEALGLHSSDIVTQSNDSNNNESFIPAGPQLLARNKISISLNKNNNNQVKSDTQSNPQSQSSSHEEVDDSHYDELLALQRAKRQAELDDEPTFKLKAKISPQSSPSAFIGFSQIQKSNSLLQKPTEGKENQHVHESSSNNSVDNNPPIESVRPSSPINFPESSKVTASSSLVAKFSSNSPSRNRSMNSLSSSGVNSIGPITITFRDRSPPSNAQTPISPVATRSSNNNQNSPVHPTSPPLPDPIQGGPNPSPLIEKGGSTSPLSLSPSNIMPAKFPPMPRHAGPNNSSASLLHFPPRSFSPTNNNNHFPLSVLNGRTSPPSLSVNACSPPGSPPFGFTGGSTGMGSSSPGSGSGGSGSGGSGVRANSPPVVSLNNHTNENYNSLAKKRKSTSPPPL